MVSKKRSANKSKYAEIVNKDSSLSGIDSMTDNFESTSLDSDSFTYFKSKNTTRIEEYFHPRVFVQHAGELLLNLRELTKKCDTSLSCKSDVFVMYFVRPFV